MAPTPKLIRALTAFALTGCAGMQAGLPDPGPPPATGASHPWTVAVLPFEDGRLKSEASDAQGLYVYNGVLYQGTRLEDLDDPAGRFTESFARHLLRTGLFARLVLVRDPAQAQDADLLLKGTIRRARGYVEKKPEGDPRVLAEVMVADLVLEDPKTQEVRFGGETGWAIVEQRPEARPWSVLGEALGVAVDRWADAVREADLVGFRVVEQASLPKRQLEGPLASWTGSEPPGWTFTSTSGRRPEGWTGQAVCDEGTFTQRQVLRFNRAVGPYVPRVIVWRCPSDVRLRWDRSAEFPARVLGTDAQGRWLLVWSLGSGAWPAAEAELQRALSLDPPPRRYIFRLPMGPDPARSLAPSPRQPGLHDPLL